MRAPKGGETSCKTLQEYIELYSGPEYSLHYKYSGIQTVVYMTMIFGAGLPILFPIALVTFIVLFLVENTMLFYGCRAPPKFDSMLA